MAFGVLRVVANPFCGGHRALDSKGRAAARVSYPNDPNRYVGAEKDHAASKAEKRVVMTHDHGKVVELHCPDFETYLYWLRKLEEGALLPADEKTARRTGTLASRQVVKNGKPVLEAFHKDHALALSEAKATAIAQFTSEHGFTPAIANEPAPAPATAVEGENHVPSPTQVPADAAQTGAES